MCGSLPACRAALAGSPRRKPLQRPSDRPAPAFRAPLPPDGVKRRACPADLAPEGGAETPCPRLTGFAFRASGRTVPSAPARDFAHAAALPSLSRRPAFRQHRGTPAAPVPSGREGKPSRNAPPGTRAGLPGADAGPLSGSPLRQCTPLRVPAPRERGSGRFSNGRSGGARTRTSAARGRTTGDHEEPRVSRGGFPTIRSPVDGSLCIRVTAYRKLGHQTGRCRMTGKAVRLLYLGPFPSAHLLAPPFFRVARPACHGVHRVAFKAADVFPSCITEREIEDGGLAAASGVQGPPNRHARQPKAAGAPQTILK